MKNPVNSEKSARTARFPKGISSHGPVNITLGEVVDITAREYGEKEALAVDGIRKTWKEFNQEVNALAYGLIKIGIGKGQIVSIWAKNRYEWMVSWYAIAKIGAILVPLDYWYRGNEAHYILHHSETSAIICTSNYIPILKEMEALPYLQHIILMDESNKEGETEKLEWRTHLFHKLIDLNCSNEQIQDIKTRQEQIKMDDVAFILYTSGTTGKPKGAMLTHANIVRNNIEVAKALQTNQKDAFLIPVPFSHCFGCELGMTTATLTGSKMVPLFDQTPKVALETIQKERCSIVHGTPTHFIRYLDYYKKHPKLDLDCLRSGIVAGAPCPIPVMKKTMNTLNLKDITNGYGMTETSPIITITTPNDPLEKRMTTVGKPISDIEVRIVDENNKVLPAGKEGELVCRGWNVMKGYYKNNEATENAIDEENWMHTGDLANKDPEGYYRITGRIKDLIIYGGANVYPKIVEDFLLGFDDIYEAAVIGIPDEEYGEVVGGVLNADAKLTKQEVVDRCYGNLNDFSVPRYVFFDIAIPLNGRGKVQKYLLRKSLAKLKKEGRIGEKVVPKQVRKRRRTRK